MNRILLALCMAFTLLGPATAGAQDCNRSCLKQHLDAYLNAVASHNPASGKLWAGFRQTENAVVIPLGEGLWKSVTALGSVQRQYFDPAQGQAGYYGTVMMGSEEAVVALRLKVQKREATEAEWFIARKSDPGSRDSENRNTPFDLDQLRATLPAPRVVPKSERMSRELMQAVVNSYFDGITNHDGRLVQGHPGCTRYENGFPTFGGAMSPQSDVGNDGKGDCRTQTSPNSFGVATVAIRNFYILDEEAQVVMAEALFIRVAGDDRRRNHFTEVFHLDHGKIRDIHAAFHYPQDNVAVPNWPPYFDGLFPLPAKYR
ncbi:MAG: hypothetical protein LBE59_00185 [Nevskiaceae bacterium]|jgi:hypothetical protein|nr:hypothetical protein [Nevskiaceae bacterium]